MAVSSMSRSHTSGSGSGIHHRVSFAKLREPLEVPNLLALQTDSFDWLVGRAAWRARQTDPTPSGLDEILEEISVKAKAGDVTIPLIALAWRP